MPSSETSFTVTGLPITVPVPEAVTVFEIPPASTSPCVNKYVAMYVAVSPKPAFVEGVNVPSAETPSVPWNIGCVVNINGIPLAFVNISTNATLVKVTLPVFCTVIVNSTVSPTPVTPSPLSTILLIVFVVSIEGSASVIVIVGSSGPLPSLSD